MFTLQQQLDAYIAWINSQLKKKTGVRPIQDLRNDMKDGINFVYIIEIVCKFWGHFCSIVDKPVFL